MDEVFKALADPSRRRLLDRLHARNGQSLRELSEGLRMSRQAVSKHLAVLEEACLIATVRRGREKLHYLNPVPIGDIAERWIDRYSRGRVSALADLRHALEEKNTMSRPEFVYVTVIRTTPERLWQALTDPAFIRRYYEEAGPDSDWKEGSPVRWKMNPAGEFRDYGQKVLVAEPCRKLSYTWHNYEPEIAAMFGWSDEKLAELRKEKISKVTFEIEPLGEAVKLTVIHDDFDPGSEMLKGVSEGWPFILSGLKSLLETGEPLPSADPHAPAEA